MKNILKNDSRLSLPNEIYSNFSLLRKSAERKARWQLKKEDIQLKNIYETFCLTHGLPFNTIEQLCTIELDIEAAFLRPIKVTCDHIKSLLAVGQKVIFISDSYFPTAFIKSQLASYGINVDATQIYVSGDIGFRKVSGRLYQYIFKTLQIQSQELHHFGDNLLSDVIVPQILGVTLIKHLETKS
ncbi:MAG: hypothetical protein H6754_07585 [Candidatus Omnitrophica bacterium]|nr:hypothetical protein [Candidatus Omnitrophota bacterium]